MKAVRSVQKTNFYDLAIRLAFFGVFLFAIVEAFKFPGVSRIFPLVVGITGFAISLYLVMVEIKVLFAEGAKQIQVAFNLRAFLRMETVLMALTVGYLAALWLIGYIVSSLIFIILSIRILGERNYIKSGLISIFTVALTYFLFRQWLSVPLPSGVLW